VEYFLCAGHLWLSHLGKEKRSEKNDTEVNEWQEKAEES
jgi:hypothetical protein